MATPLIIGAALAGLLPLGALAGRSNKQIMDKLNMFPKRTQQLSKITELWIRATRDGDNEEAEIILDNFINLCLTVIDNNQSKSDNNINIELLNSLTDALTTTFSSIPPLLYQGKEDIFGEIGEKIDELKGNYTRYIYEQDKNNTDIDDKLSIEVYEYVSKLLQLPFHMLVRSTTEAEATKCELMVEENQTLDEMYKIIEKTYIEDSSNSLLTTIYYCITKLNSDGDYNSKVTSLKNKIVEQEKIYRDDLAKQAVALYPYYFDINRDENTQLGEYLDVINIKINGLVGLSTLGKLGSVLDENYRSDETQQKSYSKQFEDFIKFVKKDLVQQRNEKEKRIEIDKRERDGAKKRKKIFDNEDDELLLLMLIMEEED
jgi:hypothetical protein